MTSVSGSDKFKYDSEQGVLLTVIRVQSAGAKEILTNYDFHFLLGMHFVFVSLYRLGLIPESASSETSPWDLSWHDIQLITSIALFQLVFNSVQVYKRYIKLHNLAMKMLRNVVKLSWQCRIFIGRATPQYVALSGRYHLAAATVFLESLKYPKEAHLSQDALFCGLSTHLLNDDEKAYLKEFDTTHRSMVLMQWCAEVIQEGFHTAQQTEELPAMKRESNLKACLMKIDVALHCQQQLGALRELPTPFKVYHLMNMMVLVNIFMWAYWMGITHAWSSSFVFIGSSVIFMNMERVAKRLQDPFGEKHRLDFPLQEWCTDCWHAVTLALRLDTPTTQRERKPGAHFPDPNADPTLGQTVWDSLMGPSSGPIFESSADFTNEAWKEVVEQEPVPQVPGWNRARPLKNDGFGLGTAQDLSYKGMSTADVAIRSSSHSDLETGARIQGALMSAPLSVYSEDVDVQQRTPLIQDL